MAWLANDSGYFTGAVVNQPAGHFVAGFIHAGHHLTALKLALHGFDAHRQQALALIFKHPHSTRIEHQLASGFQVSLQPLFARRHWFLVRG